jgi:hypothetical protein
MAAVFCRTHASSTKDALSSQTALRFVKKERSFFSEWTHVRKDFAEAGARGVQVIDPKLFDAAGDRCVTSVLPGSFE